MTSGRVRRSLSGSAWSLWIAAIVLQSSLSAALYGSPHSRPVRIVGWVVGLAVLGLNVAAIATLRRRGQPIRGQDYTTATVLVDSGIYGVVRHPQYLGFMLLSVFLALVVQHWLVATLGCAAIALVCKGIVPEADRANVDRFGEVYRHYRARVPAVDIVTGIGRSLQRRSRDPSREAR